MLHHCTPDKHSIPRNVEMLAGYDSASLMNTVAVMQGPMRRCQAGGDGLQAARTSAPWPWRAWHNRA